MAYKISTTEVIDTNRVLQNIEGTNGNYNSFYSSAVTIDTVINFATPMMSRVLSGNITFSESNKAAGRSAMLLLDTSSDFHTPDFSVNVKWQNNVTPTWSGHRYWQIALQCIDSTTVRGIALGYESTGGPPPSETITLEGTSNSDPDRGFFFGSSPTWTGAEWATYNGWVFKSNGEIEVASLDFGGLEMRIPYGRWNNVTPSQTYYIRFTLDGGNASSGSIFGMTDPSWAALNADQAVAYSTTGETYGSYGLRNFITKVEIASDSGGSTILATGWYELAWEGGV